MSNRFTTIARPIREPQPDLCFHCTVPPGNASVLRQIIAWHRHFIAKDSLSRPRATNYHERRGDSRMNAGGVLWLESFGGFVDFVIQTCGSVPAAVILSAR